MAIATIGRQYIGHYVKLLLVGLTYFIITGVVIVTSALMTIALLKFVKIIQQKNFKKDLNRVFIGLQIASLMIWSAAWIAIGIDFLVHMENLSLYSHVKMITITDEISINANLANFLIMALILYKSARVAALRRRDYTGEMTDVTFLQYLKTKYLLQEQQEANVNS